MLKMKSFHEEEGIFVLQTDGSQSGNACCFSTEKSWTFLTAKLMLEMVSMVCYDQLGISHLLAPNIKY